MERGEMSQAHQIESKEAPAGRNLLTDYEGTFAAMAEVEGSEYWKNLNSKDEEYSTIGAVKYLESLRQKGTRFGGPSEDELPIVCEVYGDGGLTRWGVRIDGEVLFSEFHAKGPGLEEKLEKAKRLGFKLY
jgi:hypothetical protein